jgi:hypothetical protein
MTIRFGPGLTRFLGRHRGVCCLQIAADSERTGKIVNEPADAPPADHRVRLINHHATKASRHSAKCLAQPEHVFNPARAARSVDDACHAVRIAVRIYNQACSNVMAGSSQPHDIRSESLDYDAPSPICCIAPLGKNVLRPMSGPPSSGPTRHYRRNVDK